MDAIVAADVVGHATSSDLERWTAMPPLSVPQSGFGHLEVPQVVAIDGRWLLVFCCNAPRLANGRAGEMGGIWTAAAAGPTGPFDIARASLLVDERYYAGRLVRTRAGNWVLLAFNMGRPDEPFTGGISDPMPLTWTGERFVLAQPIRGAA